MRPRLDALEGYLVDRGADWASRAGDAVSRPFTRLEGYCNRRYWTRRRRNAPPSAGPNTASAFARAMQAEIQAWREVERTREARWWIPVDDLSVTSDPRAPSTAPVLRRWLSPEAPPPTDEPESL